MFRSELFGSLKFEVRDVKSLPKIFFVNREKNKLRIKVSKDESSHDDAISETNYWIKSASESLYINQ